MFHDSMVWITILTFLGTLIFILWRPRGINEAIPAAIGALIVISIGSVSFSDLGVILKTVGGAAITILATIVMAIVLESFGFFRLAAEKLAEKAKGSGVRLFWYINLLCFLMTLLFNNDGGILITTPILVMLVNNMGLKNQQKVAYLLSGGLIATASSAPIGVSNIVNLIALKIVHMTLWMHTAMMFVPATLGLLILAFLLFLRFRSILPKHVPTNITGITDPSFHPLKTGIRPGPKFASEKTRTKFMLLILLFVFAVRIGLFIAAFFGIPISIVAVAGSVFLLGWRWMNLKIHPGDLIKKTPWFIIVFAFGMYTIIYGLNNIGLTNWLVKVVDPLISGSLLHTSMLMGILLSVMSNLFNNHPALMVGTITLMHMHLDLLSLKIAYLANIVGSDMGSLILPMGTLASLMWMYIVRRGNVQINWSEYIKTTIVVIPPTVLFTLMILYSWVSTFFGGVLIR